MEELHVGVGKYGVRVLDKISGEVTFYWSTHILGQNTDYLAFKAMRNCTVSKVRR